jgi:hypothetical protein
MTSPDLDLSPERRDRIVDAMRCALEDAIVGSAFTLRGSLADESADRYSDIDAAWEVPDGRVRVAFDALREALGVVGNVFSVRVAPAALAEGSCLIFVTFTDLPVFWRLDLAIETPRPVGGASLAAATEWSRPESALANAIAAIRAVLRGRLDDAAGLLERGYPRVGAVYVPSGSWRTDVVQLTTAARRADSRVAERSEQIRSTAEALLPE